MRTYILVVVSALVLSFGVSSATAETTALDTLLQKFGLLPAPPVAPEGSSDSQDASAPEAPQSSHGFMDNVAALFAVATAPVAAMSQGLVNMGLGLVGGLFAGFGEGGATVAKAATTVLSHPAQSTVVAGLSIAIFGVASGLGILAQRYGGLGGIPLYSRIAKSQLLENDLRQQIFTLIQQNPGINVSEIARRLDIAWGTATHHLHKLRQEKMVGIRVASNQKCYFPNGGTYTPHEMDVMSALKNDTAKKIAEFLVKTGPKNHGDIASALGLTPALVSFHARKLVDNGVVARHRDGRHTIFTPLEPNLTPEPRPMQAH